METREPRKTSRILVAVAALIGGIIGSSAVRLLFDGFQAGAANPSVVAAAKKMNAMLPMQIDKITRWDSAIPGPGNRLTYMYTTIGVSLNEIDVSELRETIRPVLVNNYQTHPEMEAFRSQNIELHYHYRDQSGRSITTIVVSPKDFAVSKATP